MEAKKRGSFVVIPTERHGHLVTPGSAEGESETIDQALENQARQQHRVDRQRSGREARKNLVKTAGNRKNTAA